MIHQSDIRYGTLNRGILVRAFRRTNVTAYRTAWRRMTHFRPSVFTRTNQEGIDRLQRFDGRRFAFILPHPIGEYVAATQQPCNVIAVGRFLAHGGYALAVPRPSTAISRGALNAALRRLSDLGFLNHLYEKWWTEYARCTAGSIRTTAGQRGSTSVAAMRRGDDIRRGDAASGIKLRAVDRLVLLDSTVSKAWSATSLNGSCHQLCQLLFVLAVSCAALYFMI